MFLSTVTANLELIVASMAAVSVFSASIVVSWPYLAKDNLGDRMRQIAKEREAIRTRERTKLQAGKTLLSLTTKPKQGFKNIFDRMNLAKQAEDGAMVKKLRMAGYRGHGPVVTFVAVRLIMPIALFVTTALYIFAILPLDYPFFFKIGIVVAAACLGYYFPALY